MSVTRTLLSSVISLILTLSIGSSLQAQTPVVDADQEPARFFSPYKDNYLSVGRMRMKDGSTPFSGEDLDIKFELGMTFSFFDNSESFDFLDPLRFGYSQRSWWNITEDSSPFTEHNYNPEMFWRFDHPLIDIIGFEHQSNGQSGLDSRSWDRLYAQKSFQLADNFTVDLKLWSVVSDEENNADIRDYLGSAQLGLNFEPNDRTVIRARIIKGRNHSKISYQADIRYQRPWLNSAFYLVYYEGYGEALISYNKKSRSLRAGLYFPLDTL
ncbi:phospholipase A [Pseudohongiella spirulinae]|uniref:Phospholipase A1 n=1 Tax=Pseudohongiella spirulinae TaxID=1249552 RepID=A0A0S2KG14_9GAMM|nr:phospholipase A [Pseudohongiella spirulinae]ALO47270.1 hypothetical protein PS2015_2638 [Pseudohongiella spirulinae]